MKIAKNTVVQFHYRLRDEASGEELENSRSGDPVLYLQGYSNIIAGLEKAMLGHEVGDVFSVSLTAEQAYGRRNEDKTQRVPVKHLMQGKTHKNLKPGMVVHIQTDQGKVPATVIKVGKFTVDVDTNHPLAGKPLGFDIEILAVRDATAEEMAHRHAHGVGGHNH